MSALRQGRQGVDPEQIHEVASYGWQAVRAEGVRILMLRVSNHPTPAVQTSTQSSCPKYYKDVATSALGRYLSCLAVDGEQVVARMAEILMPPVLIPRLTVVSWC